MLSLEILETIAGIDLPTYSAMLAVPAFGRSTLNSQVRWTNHFTKECEGESGIFWTLNGRIHRGNDLPAIINPTYQTWCQHGKTHRDNDLPAIVMTSGGQQWFLNDELHRDGDRPAIITSIGDQHWYLHGRRHRDNDQPAVIYASGARYWYVNGLCHRDGGRPAAIYDDGTYRHYNQGDPCSDLCCPQVHHHPYST